MRMGMNKRRLRGYFICAFVVKRVGEGGEFFFLRFDLI